MNDKSEAVWVTRLMAALAGVSVCWSLRAGPLDDWRPAEVAPAGDLRAIAFGKGLFVAVGSAGTAFSAGGRNWQRSNGGSNFALHSVAYGNGVFVAVGENRFICRSLDGQNWIGEFRNGSNHYSSVAFGDGMFVIVCDNGAVLLSSDGSFWIAQTTGTAAIFSGVTYGQRTFIAVGDSKILSSPDGLAWTDRTGVPVDHLRAAAYGNGTFVAVGDWDCVVVSTNGTNWTDHYTEFYNSFRGVAFGSGTFVAVGYDGLVATSRDGLRWTARQSGTAAHLYGITHASGTFLAVGDYGTVIQSAELPVITVAATAPSAGEPPRAVRGEIKLTRTGSLASDLVANFSISGTAENGIDYAAVSNSVVIPAGESSVRLAIAPLEDNAPEPIETLSLALQPTEDYGFHSPGTATVIIGNAAVTIAASDSEAAEGTTDTAAITFTRSGNTSEPLAVQCLASGSATPGADYPFVSTAIIPAGEHSVSVLISASEDRLFEDDESIRITVLPADNYVAAAPTTAALVIHDNEPPLVPDLDTWSARNPPDYIGDFQDVTFGNGTFVAVATDRILMSPDGKQWTSSSNSFTGLRAVTYGEGQFVAVGEAVLATSPDGSTWTEGNSGIRVPLHEVAYGNRLFVAVGALGTIITSSNAMTWSVQSSGTTADLRGISYGDEVFVAVGSAYPHVILTSTNGIVWNKTDADAGYLNASAFGEGFNVIVGGGENWFSSYSIILTSPDAATWTRSAQNFGVELQDVAYGHGSFVAVGNSYWGSPAQVFTSADGITWKRRPTESIGSLLRSVAYGHRTFVAVGTGGTILQSALMPPLPRFSHIDSLPDGSIRLFIETPARVEITLEASTDMTEWTELQTWTINGVLEFTDTPAPPANKRFYRAKLHLP